MIVSNRERLNLTCSPGSRRTESGYTAPRMTGVQLQAGLTGCLEGSECAYSMRQMLAVRAITSVGAVAQQSEYNCRFSSENSAELFSIRKEARVSQIFHRLHLEAGVFIGRIE